MTTFAEAGIPSGNELINVMYPQEMILQMMGTDPQPVLDAHAQKCPMHEVAPGWFTVLRMQDCVEINRHRAVIGNGSTWGMGGDHKLIPLDIDGALHTHFRKLIDPVFAPKRIAPLAERIAEQAGDLIDKFVADGETELFSSFCQPLPSLIFLSILGLPAEELPFFLEIKEGILRHEPFADPAEVERQQIAAREQCFGYFGKLYDERTSSGDLGDDLLGWLIGSSVDGHELTRDQFLNIMLLMIIGGLDTVAASLSCIMSWLARHPAERRWILEDESRWPAAIEDLLRFESPVPQGFRQTTEEIEVNGTSFAAGTRFLMSWPAINLDPETFADPLTVDLQRSPNPHVVFASGWHRCLGSHLARLELRVAMEEFHRRIPEYSIKPDTELQYIPLGVRQVMNLPVVWDV
ncbi:MAG: cytochrome P450 [Actinomycetota bacterium]|nr:cytochrome P450 [Actinomycetota bacterium]